MMQHIVNIPDFSNKRFAESLYLRLDHLELLILLIMILLMLKCSNEVYNSLLVLDCIDPPVVHHEG